MVREEREREMIIITARVCAGNPVFLEVVVGVEMDVEYSNMLNERDYHIEEYCDLLKFLEDIVVLCSLNVSVI